MLAVLSIIAVAAFHLPQPFQGGDGGAQILFALGIYAVCISFIILILTPVIRVRDAFGSKFRVLFVGSVAVVILYCVAVSIALIALSRSTDL